MWKHRKWMPTNIYSSCCRYLNTPPKGLLFGYPFINTASYELRIAFLAFIIVDVKSQMPIAYQAANVETGWYPWWEKNNFFRSEDPRNSTTERFSMVLPRKLEY